MECKITGCDKDNYGNGLCRKHYMQMRIYGKIKERTHLDNNEFRVDGEITQVVYYNRQGEELGTILIDTEDVSKCNKYKWCRGAGGYAISPRNRLLMSYLILDKQPEFGLYIDHVNQNKLDNRKSNLRICTNSENNCNKDKQSRNSSGYKGVYKQDIKWKAEITKDGVYYSLGRFNTPEEAALVYNKAAKELHGKFAVLNNVKPKLKRKS